MPRPKGRYARPRKKGRRLPLCLAGAAIAVVLTGTVFVQRAFATTYVITDGDTVMTYTSFATDPAQVLGEAGLSLNENDTFTTQAMEGTETITIRRARSVTIEYHGSTRIASVQEGTVGELLSQMNLELTGEDLVSHGMDAPLMDGMVIRVDRLTTVQEVYCVPEPHEVRVCDDPSLPAGTEEVLIGGKDGELMCTADVTYRNGQEICRQVLSKTRTRAPVTEIIGRGTGSAGTEENGLEIGDGYIKLPTGELLTYTRKDTVRATAYTHTDSGCDLVTATGTTVHRGTVAVDPRYIPYGTRMFIVASDGSYVYGLAAAEDCGGDIKGDRMDLYLPTYEECREFGRRRCTIYFLG